MSVKNKTQVTLQKLWKTFTVREVYVKVLESSDWRLWNYLYSLYVVWQTMKLSELFAIEDLIIYLDMVDV